MGINVTVRDNVNVQNVIMYPTDTIREAFEKAGISCARGVVHLDGAALLPTELDKTFESLGVEGECFLSRIIKTDNA